MTKKQKKVLIRIIVSAFLVLISLFIHNDILQNCVLFVSYILIGFDVLKKAFKGIIRRQVFDENFLMAIATVGAVCLKDFFEAVAVMLFYQAGELFQSIAVGKSRKSINNLLDIIPQKANLVTDDGVVEISPDEVEKGSVILVKPGERIPLDGTVIEGETSVDTSALTGESMPGEIYCGDTVLSGCINITSVIKIKTTKEFDDSTVSKILELVENSSMKKSKSEQFISRFAKYYTPIVCVFALVVGLIVPLMLTLTGFSPSWNSFVVRALTFLVISCPCALVISIPLSFFGGIGCASKNGILIKGSNYLEILSKVKHFVFDKTGTVTNGKFSVTKIKCADGVTEDEVLYYAAYCECNSTHPVARGIMDAFDGEIDFGKINEATELAGYGVKAKIAGKEVLAGNLKLMQDMETDVISGEETATNVFVAVDKKCIGCIMLSDTPKKNSKQTIAMLRKKGVKSVTLLTGDFSQAADKVGKDLGFDNVISNLLPHQKIEELEKIINDNEEKVCYVGDGINDAPVLARADVGISMGALGSDAAIEASDVVLMDDDPLKLVTAVSISHKTVRIAKENIVFALGIKFICLVLGALGIAGMNLAIFADVGVMIIAVINAMRTMKIK